MHQQDFFKSVDPKNISAHVPHGHAQERREGLRGYGCNTHMH